MNSQIEHMGNSMFPDQGGRVANVKFYLNRRGVTGAQLADQLQRADAQIRQGAALRVTNIDEYQPC